MIRRLKGFKRGGVHPHDMKSLTRDCPIIQLPLAGELTIPLSQHIGAPATALVEVGDPVSVGQKIGEAAGFISANIHSPADGKVTAIKKVLLPSGAESDALVIQTSEAQSPPDYRAELLDQISSAQISTRIFEAGIVGAGGATFPTHVKLSVPKGKKAEFLVINGVECEPYLNADNRLMLESADRIIEGIAAIAKMVNPQKIIFGIENNKPGAIASMREASLNAALPLEVVPLRVRYPQGDEKQLLKAVIGREVPSGALPIEVGAVVVNVGTVNAIYDAVYLKKPFYERVVTVSGKALANPGNFRVHIGTSLRELVEAAGSAAREPRKWVAGGPMMGFAFYNLDDTPVIKGTSGILGLTASEVNASEQTNCLNCGKCIRSCPMGLMPTALFRRISNGEFDELIDLGLMDCKECGCCSFICPAQLPLVHGFKMGKRETRKMKGNS